MAKRYSRKKKLIKNLLTVGVVIIILLLVLMVGLRKQAIFFPLETSKSSATLISETEDYYRFRYTFSGDPARVASDPKTEYVLKFGPPQNNNIEFFPPSDAQRETFSASNIILNGLQGFTAPDRTIPVSLMIDKKADCFIEDRTMKFGGTVPAHLNCQFMVKMTSEKPFVPYGLSSGSAIVDIYKVGKSAPEQEMPSNEGSESNNENGSEDTEPSQDFNILALLLTLVIVIAFIIMVILLIKRFIK